MNYRQINELDRIIKQFTPEQIGIKQQEAEWQDKSWSRGDLVSMLSKVLPNCSRNSLELALEDTSERGADWPETFTALNQILFSLIYKAICYQYALELRDFQPEPDDDNDVAELLGGSYGSFPIKHNDIASPQPAVGK